MKNKNLNCKECGNDEFITEPNKYDVYKAEEGKLEFQKSKSRTKKAIAFPRKAGRKIRTSP